MPFSQRCRVVSFHLPLQPSTRLFPLSFTTVHKAQQWSPACMQVYWQPTSSWQLSLRQPGNVQAIQELEYNMKYSFTSLG